MISEALIAHLAILSEQNNNVVINDLNAHSVGIDINEMRRRFENETGRVILTNENIKVLFNQEGGHLDFSTFDDVIIRVDFNSQRVAPNKGGDGFE